MSLPLGVVEIYLSMNVLLIGGSFTARRWTRSARSNLVLARLTLLACVVAPFAMSFVRPRHNFVLSSATDVFEPHSKPQAVSADKQAYLARESETVGETSSAPDFSTVLATLVAFGCLSYLIRFGHDAVRAYRIVSRCVVLRRHRHAYVVVSGETTVPFSVRILHRAYVVLPTSMMADSRAAMIATAHEAEHHRQGDCIIAYAVELLRAACFWNPFVRRWQGIHSDLQEFSCDETLVGRRHFTSHEYARCLFDVAQAAVASFSPSREFACAPGMARQGRGKAQTLLLRRIEMLSKSPSAASRSTVLYPAVAAALVILPFGGAFAARGTIAGPQAEAPDQSDLDPRIQNIAEDELQAAMTRLRAKSAVALVMNPASGRLLAFAEAHTGSTDESWSTRVITPASTIKPFIFASAVEAGVASESSTYDCRAPYNVAGYDFHNWDDNFGAGITATRAIASSVNVCVIRMAQDAGSTAVRASLSRFGLAPSWQDGMSDGLQLARAAVGDNEPVTVTQLTKAFATLANSGRIPGANQPVISEATAEAVRRTMVQVVRSGTGRHAALPRVQVAGKTGTSAIGDAADDKPLLAMFGGFVPAEQPQYAALVIVEDGRNEAGDKIGGGAAAAPIFREIVRRSLSLVN